MADRKMIYLDDAINALEIEKTYSAVYKYGYTQTDYFKQYNMGLTDGVKALNKLPSAQPEQQWTPVSEALPKDDEDVIVTCLDDSGDTPFSYTTVAWHYKGMWVCDNMRCLFVIAWMPLPEPYAERKENASSR